VTNAAGRLDAAFDEHSWRGNYAPRQRCLFQPLRGGAFDPLAVARKWRDIMRALDAGAAADADKAMSLMALVLQFIHDGQTQPGVDEYAKRVFSLVHRTNFCSM
jgi:hypothetical protein